MKKLLLILSIIIFSCSSDDDKKCYYNGTEFIRSEDGRCYYIDGNGNRTYVDQVRCNC